MPAFKKCALAYIRPGNDVYCKERSGKSLKIPLVLWDIIYSHMVQRCAFIVIAMDSLYVSIMSSSSLVFQVLKCILTFYL